MRRGQINSGGGECVQGGGEKLPQRRPQPLQVPGPLPDQRLVHPRHEFEPLDRWAVSSHLPVVGPIKPDDLGQHVCIHRVEAWDSVGYAYHRLGDHGRALVCYQHALGSFRDLGNRFLGADTLTNIGDTDLAAGAADAAACRAWRDALSILDDLDHSRAELVRTKPARPVEPQMAPPGRARSRG